MVAEELQASTAVAERLMAEGWLLAGAVQANPDGARGNKCHMDLHVLATGDVIRISQDLGALARGCRLDAGGLASAVGLAEASLEKGRGYVTKILVQHGTLRVQDILVAGEGSLGAGLGAAIATVGAGLIVGLIGAAVMVLLLKQYLIPDHLQPGATLMFVVAAFVVWRHGPWVA